MTRSLLVAIGAILLGALAVRLGLVLASDAYTNGDSDNYLTVAANIVRNFCVSRSDPASGACQPDWGGNQPLPGYPAFIALSWLVLGHSVFAVQLLQTVAAVAAAARMTYAVWAYTRRRDVTLAVAALLALSPLQVALPRAILTEPLATATTIWVMAELILSLAERRLRIVSLGCALAAAIFVRPDAVVLCLVVAGAAFYLHRPPVALARGALVALLVLLPVAGWIARAETVGLSFPRPASGHDWPFPPGMLAWAMTWSESDADEHSFIVPVFDADYSEIAIPSHVYVDAAEQESVQRALAELRAQAGEPVPASIDAVFGSLAAKRRASHPVATLVAVPVKRALYMWLSPAYAFDWPIRRFSLEEGAAIAHTGYASLAGLLSMIARYPMALGERALVNGYRLVVLLGFATCVVLCRRASLVRVRPVVAIVASYVVLRTIFMSWIAPGLGTRYIVEALPAMEIVCVLGLLYARGGAKHPVAAEAQLRPG